MKNKYISLAIGVSLLFQSCATLLGGSKDNTRVKQGTPPNARVYLNGEYMGIAPQTVRVQKNARQGNNYIELKADGYETARIDMTRKVSVGYFLLDWFTGGLWLVVDFATGNIYKPRPNRIDYYLEMKEGYVKPQTPTPTEEIKTSFFVKENFKTGETVMWQGIDQKHYKGEIIGLFNDKAAVKYEKGGEEKTTNIPYKKLAKTTGEVGVGFNVGEKIIWKGIDQKNKTGQIIALFETKALVKNGEKLIEIRYDKLAKTTN